jgi:hypothetical protein
MEIELTPADEKILQDRGIRPDELLKHRRMIERGFPFVRLHGNAEPGKHIKVLTPGERDAFRDRYAADEELEVMKFVPASGAASRMFKELFGFLEDQAPSETVKAFIDNLDRYPFFGELRDQSGLNFAEGNAIGKRAIEFLLSEEGMNYGAMPKGLIPFHRYPDGHHRTAFEEHFHEGAMYAKKKNVVKLHFTIPHENTEEVKDHLQGIMAALSERYETRFEVETSIQKPSTDTPALYSDGTGFVRKEDGQLLFRPAGHGALIENLNDLDSDLIFVKNIDNVVPDRLKPLTVEYKEVLAGMLLEVREGIHMHCRAFASRAFDRDDCLGFISKWFGEDCSTYSDQELFAQLNRPLRVCGMVKNEGEPGGGPFLVAEPTGNPSLQIVEKAQIDKADEAQQAILNAATHFNPVDLVLSVKDHEGKKFDLLEYRNEQTGMVVDKTFEGRQIKALELPGLWNGAMHYWNTIFVEVPLETFNPVKTVFDLQRPNHRQE